MARIDSYQKAPSPISGADKLIGTDSANNNETKNFTIQEIADFVGFGPYKVYTALLTQGGGDNVQQIDGGDLTIGVTYNIDSYGDGDFIIVGAPNNNIGTKFVATGTTPIWGGGALSYNTGAPTVVSVLENTIGNIWFTYRDGGSYGVQSNGLFTNLKSTMLISNVTWDGGSGIIKSGFDSAYDGFITTALANGDPINNGSLINTPIEIRVYN